MIGHIALWLILTGFAILTVDCAIGWYIEWRDARDKLIRDERLNKYSMGAFKGTKDWRHL